MAAAVNSPMAPATPEQLALRRLRLAKFLRAALYFVAGVVIAFTATLHRELGFDLTIAAASLVLFALAALNEHLRSERTLGRSAQLLQIAVAVLAAGGLLLVNSPKGFAVVLAVWALFAGLLEFLALALGTTSRQDSLFMGAIGLLLAIAVLIVRDDQVAIVGFFGAYALVVGVFLGISAFDQRSALHAETEADNAYLRATPAVTSSATTDSADMTGDIPHTSAPQGE